MDTTATTNETKTKAGTAEAMIRADILHGKLPSGTRLAVVDLSARYRIGASPMREALVALSHQKILSFEPQKGAFLPPLSKKELGDLALAICHLAPPILTRAASNTDEKWRLDLLARIHAGRFAPQTKGISDMRESLHREFHLALASGSTNNVMVEMFGECLLRLERYLYRWLATHPASVAPYNDIGRFEALLRQLLSVNPDTAIESYCGYWRQLEIKIGSGLALDTCQSDSSKRS